LKNYVDQVATLTSYGNANVTSFLPTYAGTIATVTNANLAMKGYVDNSTTAANVGMKGYVDNSTTAANVGMVGFVNQSITLANTGAVGLINYSNTIQTSATQQAITAANVGMIGKVDNSVATANIGMVGYVDNKVTINTVDAHQYYQPIANVAITGNANIKRLLVAPSSVSAKISFFLDVTLPNVAVNGSTFKISSNVAVQFLRVLAPWSAVTLDSGATANIALAAGTQATYMVSSSSQKWFKVE
jgi:hypothetical protein